MIWGSGQCDIIALTGRPTVALTVERRRLLLKLKKEKAITGPEKKRRLLLELKIGKAISGTENR